MGFDRLADIPRGGALFIRLPEVILDCHKVSPSWFPLPLRPMIRFSPRFLRSPDCLDHDSLHFLDAEQRLQKQAELNGPQPQ